jgi:hypothetical protein
MQHGGFIDWTKEWVWINNKNESINSKFLEYAALSSRWIRFRSNWKSDHIEIKLIIRKWKLNWC